MQRGLREEMQKSRLLKQLKGIEWAEIFRFRNLFFLIFSQIGSRCPLIG